MKANPNSRKQLKSVAKPGEGRRATSIAQEEAKHTSKQLEALLAGPNLQGQLKDTEQRKATEANPNSQEQPKRVAKRTEGRMATANGEAAPNSQEQRKRAAKQVEGMTDTAHVQEKEEQAAEQVELGWAGPNTQQPAKPTSKQQMEATKANPNLQGQPKRAARLMEGGMVKVHPNSQEQRKRVGRVLPNSWRG